MKYYLALTLLLTSFLTYGQGDLSATLKGQNQTTKLTVGTIELPNNLATKTGSITALAELGNNNLLVNPSFEHQTFNTGWTCTGLTPVVETSTVYSGKKALKLVASASTFECYQDSTINAAATASTQYLDAIRLLTTATGTSLKVCSRTNGTTSTLPTQCVDAIAKGANNGIYNLMKVAALGGSTSNGISIAGVAVTGNIFLDSAKVGPEDLQTPNNSCSSTDCSLSFSAYILGGGTPSVSTTSMSGWIASVSNVSTGRTRITFKTNLFTVSPLITVNPEAASADFQCSFAVTGTVSVDVYCSSAAAFSSANFSILAQKQGADVSNALALTNGSTYSSTNSDTGWLTCIQGSGTQALGTSPTYTFQCKRDGSDLLMKGQLITTATPSASEARISLPIWNGVQLVSANSSIIPSLQVAGAAGINASTATWVPMIEPSVAYLTLGANVGTGSGTFTKQQGNAFAAGATIGILARIPIDGWEQSNLMVANLSGLQSCANSYVCTNTFTAEISAAGVPSKENLEWINGNCTVSSGRYTCPLQNYLKDGVNQLTSYMACTVTSGGGGRILNYVPSASGTLAVVFDEAIPPGTSANDTGFNISCPKSPGDFSPTSAIAVASDQNTKTVGATSVEVFSFSYGIGGNLNNNCNSTPCYVDQIGTAVSSFARASTGNYTLNTVKTYSKLKCTGSYTQATVGIANGTEARCENCSSLSGIQTLNLSGTNVDTVGTINCVAIP